LSLALRGFHEDALPSTAAEVAVVSWGSLFCGIAFSWLALIGVPGAAQAPATPGLSKNDRDVTTAMLRQIKEDLQKHYYDPTFRGIDVEGQFADAEARITSATDIAQVMALLVDPLWRLGDSHTTFFPPKRSLRVDYGWEMAMVGDVPLVLHVDAGSDAAAKGLAPGDRVLALNRFQPDRTNLWQIFYWYRFIRPQALQRLSIRKPDGSERILDVKSQVTNQPLTELADLIDELSAEAKMARDRQLAVGDDTIVWKMPAFVSADAVREAAKRAHDYRTLILDLRGNGGGATTALHELVSRSFDHEVIVAVEKGRDKETREIAKPVRDPFRGSLIVLVDSRSGSAAEMFARIVQLEKRGTVIGDRSAGAVMVSRFFPHTVGLGAVVFYATSITVADVRMSDGGGLEHVGVQPDEVLLPTPTDLAAHRDPVLARALAIAGHTTTPEKASLFTRP
jgi:C-terminal processing protease CtpA/Prc